MTTSSAFDGITDCTRINTFWASAVLGTTNTNAAMDIATIPAKIVFIRMEYPPGGFVHWAYGPPMLALFIPGTESRMC